MDFIRDVLIQLEWDLEERLRKLQIKHPGIMQLAERSAAEGSSSNSGYRQDKDNSFQEGTLGSFTECCGVDRMTPVGRYGSPMGTYPGANHRPLPYPPGQASEDPASPSRAYSGMPPLPMDNVPASEDPLKTNDSRVQHLNLKVPPTLPSAYPPTAGSKSPPIGGAPSPVRGLIPGQGMTQEDVDRMKNKIMSSSDGLPVKVYNQSFALEPKRLSMNAEKR